MLALDNLPELIRKVERLKEQRSKSKGALDQLLKRLKKEHGCSTLKQGKIKLKEKGELERRYAERYAKKKKFFEKNWEHLL